MPGITWYFTKTETLKLEIKRDLNQSTAYYINARKCMPTFGFRNQLIIDRDAQCIQPPPLPLSPLLAPALKPRPPSPVIRLQQDIYKKLVHFPAESSDFVPLKTGFFRFYFIGLLHRLITITLLTLVQLS